MTQRRRGQRSALIIPDAHASPGYDNARFDWLGKFAHDVDPDYIVCLGDWHDYPSESRHDPLGSRSMEGLCYEDDRDVGDDALARFHRHYKRTRARKIVTLGNHDSRPEKAAAEDPRKRRRVEDANAAFGTFGWEITGYRDVTLVEGIAVSHHMVSGIAGRPIGGESMAKQLVHKMHTSCIVGHSHIFQHYEHTRADGQKIFGLSAGCYVHPKYGTGHTPRDTWCKDTHDKWWRGVVVLHDLDGRGYYDELRAVTQRKLRREYG